MSSPSLPESEGSTSDSNGPDIESSANARPTRTPGKSSGDIGPTSQYTKTSADSTLTGAETLAFCSRMSQNATVDVNLSPTLKIGSGPPALLTSSAEGSPARTSPSPENGQDSQANAPDCSSRPPESLTLFSGMEDGFSLRMFPDSFPRMGELTSGSFSRRWPTSGFTTSPGECWTVDSSECHNDGGAFSSLPDVLEADVPPRFYLSPRAAAGIIRRAEKRGRSLPRELDRALTELARLNHSAPGSETPGQTSPMRKPGGSSPPQPSAQNTENPQDKTSGNPEPSSPMAVSENQRAEVRETPYARQLTTGGGKPGQGYPTIRDGQTVRRLTPTECERLQGFPDGWTIP